MQHALVGQIPDHFLAAQTYEDKYTKEVARDLINNYSTVAFQNGNEEPLGDIAPQGDEALEITRKKGKCSKSSRFRSENHHDHHPCHRNIGSDTDSRVISLP